MHILVFIKQVPHGESPFEISKDGHTIQFPSNTSYAINSYDEYALEEALILAEIIPDTVISVATIGPKKAETALRRALAIGAHHAYHYIAENASVVSTFEKAEILAEHAKSHPFDIILAGSMSEDSAHAALGPMLAALLDIPWATHIMKLEVNPAEKSIRAQREIDVSTRQSITLPMPALIAVQSGINRPRYPSLSNTLRAKKQEIVEILLHRTSQSNAKSRFHLPHRTKETHMLTGSCEENARALYEYLHTKSLL